MRVRQAVHFAVSLPRDTGNNVSGLRAGSRIYIYSILVRGCVMEDQLREMLQALSRFHNSFVPFKSHHITNVLALVNCQIALYILFQYYLSFRIF